MAATSVILVRVLGNTRGLGRSLEKARNQLGGLEAMGTSITSAMRIAAIATAAFAAVAVGGAAAGAVALAGMAAGILGIGILAAAQNKKVKNAFSDMAGHVVKVMEKLAKPLQGPLIRGAETLSKAFDKIAPAFDKIFKAAGPVLDKVFKVLGNMAGPIRNTLVNAFQAGVPVLMAFVRGLIPLQQGINGFFKQLGKGSGSFAAFARTLMGGLGALLPAVGRLLTALAPIGTVILQVLIPALVSLLNWIAGKVGPAFQRVTAFFKAHQSAAKAVGLALIGLVVAIKALQVGIAIVSALATALEVLVAVVGFIASPVGLVVIAIAALIAVFVYLYRTNAKFRAQVQQIWNQIKAVFASAVNQVKKTLAVWGGWLTSFWHSNGSSILAAVRVVWNTIRGVIRGALTVIKGVIKAVMSVLRGDWKGAWQGILATTRGVWTIIKTVTRGAVDLLKMIIKAAWQAIKSVTTSIWGGIKSWLRDAWNGIKSTARDAWNALKGAIADAIRNAVSAVKDVVGNVKGWLRDAWVGIKSTAVDAWRNLVDGVKTVIGNLVDAAKGIKDKITGALSGVGNWLKSAGTNLIQGMIDGVANMATSLANKAADVVHGAVNAAKNALGIGSPSKLFRQYGKWVGEGLALGMGDRAGLAGKAAAELSRKVASGFVPPQLQLGRAQLAAGTGQTAAGTTYLIKPEIPVGASPADVGRGIVNAIDAYERAGGRRRAS